MAYEIVPCLYNTEKDLQARLHGTICRYNNIPVYVSVISSKELRLYNPKDISTKSVHGADFKTIHPTDELFDISSPEIGYFNFDFDKEIKDKTRYPNPDLLTGNLVLFCQRAPCKQWKQGLYSEIVNHSSINGKAIHCPVQWQTVFYSEGVKEMITGSYSSIPSAVNRLMRMPPTYKYRHMAVSKDVALELTDSDIIQVYLKKCNIGYILPGERTVHVKKERNSWVIRRYLEGMRALVE